MGRNTKPRKQDYDIGYKKPPKHTQFKKGQSGNPDGRKKCSRSLKKDLDAALNAKLTISVAGKQLKGTTQELAVRTLALRAASGDVRAQGLLVNLVLQVFGVDERGGEEQRLSQHDQAMLDRFLGAVAEDGKEGSGDTDPGEPDVNGGDIAG